MENLTINVDCLREFIHPFCSLEGLLPQGDILIADSLGVLSCFSGKNLYAIGKQKPSIYKVFLQSNNWKPFCVVPLPRRFDAVLVFPNNPKEDFEPSVRFVINHCKEGAFFLLRVEESFLPFAVSFLSEFSRIEVIFSSLILAKLLRFPF